MTNKTVVHIAGRPNQGQQLCSRCGIVLIAASTPAELKKAGARANQPFPEGGFVGMNMSHNEVGQEHHAAPRLLQHDAKPGDFHQVACVAKKAAASASEPVAAEPPAIPTAEPVDASTEPAAEPEKEPEASGR